MAKRLRPVVRPSEGDRPGAAGPPPPIPLMRPRLPGAEALRPYLELIIASSPNLVDKNEHEAEKARLKAEVDATLAEVDSKMLVKGSLEVQAHGAALDAYVQKQQGD